MSSPAPADRRRRPARGRRLTVQALLSVGLLLLIEAGLRALGYGGAAADQDPLVGFDGSRPLFVREADGGDWVTADYKLNHFNRERFEEPKPAGTMRIVCLGGSTTYGRPYTDHTSFPGWLERFLPEADPTRDWQVINAGGISYASYRVTQVLIELLEHEPDLVILYTGHNEFLEERTFGALQDSPALLRSLSGRLRRTGLFDWASGLVDAGGPAAAPATDAGDGGSLPLLPGEVTTLLDSSVGPDAYRRDDRLAADVTAQLRLNLERMASLCERAGVPLIVVTPASALTDCRPFKSSFSVDLEAGRRAALEALAAEEPPDREALEDAVREAPRHALLWYRLGQARQAAGDVDAARQAYQRARDEDIVPLRATSTLVETVRQVAAARDLPLLDWVARVDDLAREQLGAPLPGSELFLDHVHMTIEAYRQLALDLLALMAEQGLVSPRPTWDVEGVTERALAEVDTEAQVRALARLANVLSWAGKDAEARELTTRALELSGGGDAMSQWLLGNQLREDGDLDGAVRAYTEALAIDPEFAEARVNLGQLELGRGAFDAAAEHFELALARDDGLAEAHFGLGVVLDRRGQRPESRNALRRAIKREPEHADALNLLGVSLLKDGEVEEAEKALRAATLADPGLGRAHYNLALLLSASGRLDAAVVSYEQSLAADPDNARTWYKLGMARASLDDLSGALQALERAAALAPDDPRTAQDLERVRTRLRFQ